MTKTQTFRVSLLAALVMNIHTSAIAQDGTTFDSAGVLLGSSVAQATGALASRGFSVAKINGKYEVAADSPFVHAVQADKEDDSTRETVVVRFDEPPSSSRAFLVWRSIAFKAGKAPTLESYRAAVRSKAGNETYWRDLGGSGVEQYVQWSRSGKKRGGLFKMLDSLPSSYPNACVTGITVRSSEEALRVKTMMPVYGKMEGRGPRPGVGIIVPQELCAIGLLIFYRVPDRTTNLVTNVDVLLVDQAQMESMTAKRDEFLELRRHAQVEAAKKAAGKPVL